LQRDLLAHGAGADDEYAAKARFVWHGQDPGPSRRPVITMTLPANDMLNAPMGRWGTAVEPPAAFAARLSVVRCDGLRTSQATSRSMRLMPVKIATTLSSPAWR
jgi:hypothetical protein